MKPSTYLDLGVDHRWISKSKVPKWLNSQNHYLILEQAFEQVNQQSRKPQLRQGLKRVSRRVSKLLGE